ncbi:hypothetical protein [Methylobacter sp.]|uniref:hypothetical protein n=1 Tax=Methylobacter sp. TaxID=2051955 RepID=UPI002FDE2DC7
MKYITLHSKLSLIAVSFILVLSGCSQILVKDDTLYPRDGTAHCSGSEWTDDSSLAVVPIPIVAFFMPHADLNDIKADDYLKRCGDSSKLVNREVDIGHGACIPASLSMILTLGIWQWCPATVSWEADVRP